jgi:hypothetical protein
MLGFAGRQGFQIFVEPFDHASDFVDLVFSGTVCPSY